MRLSIGPMAPSTTTQPLIAPAGPASSASRLAAWTALALALLLLWDAGSGDMLVATLAGDGQGFPLRENWALSRIGHDGMRRLSWAFALGLCAAVWWPWGIFRRLSRSRRLQLALSTLLLPLAVTLLKWFDPTSCPWDLQAFGGVATHVSHWSLRSDGGPGRCFPAGHAASGFAFVPGYFAFRHTDPRLARRWLATALGVGLLLGLAQQWRGAHFMSHTLWTGWLCWVLAWALDAAWRKQPLVEATP